MRRPRGFQDQEREERKEKGKVMKRIRTVDN